MHDSVVDVVVIRRAHNYLYVVFSYEQNALSRSRTIVAPLSFTDIFSCPLKFQADLFWNLPDMLL